jgi:hypothetical protein
LHCGLKNPPKDEVDGWPSVQHEQHRYRQSASSLLIDLSSSKGIEQSLSLVVAQIIEPSAFLGLIGIFGKRAAFKSSPEFLPHGGIFFRRLTQQNRWKRRKEQSGYYTEPRSHGLRSSNTSSIDCFHGPPCRRAIILHRDRSGFNAGAAGRAQDTFELPIARGAVSAVFTRSPAPPSRRPSFRENRNPPWASEVSENRPG